MLRERIGAAECPFHIVAQQSSSNLLLQSITDFVVGQNDVQDGRRHGDYDSRVSSTTRWRDAQPTRTIIMRQLPTNVLEDNLRMHLGTDVSAAASIRIPRRQDVEGTVNNRNFR